jgi:hypothetical protein
VGVAGPDEMVVGRWWWGRVTPELEVVLVGGEGGGEAASPTPRVRARKGVVVGRIRVRRTEN